MSVCLHKYVSVSSRLQPPPPPTQGQEKDVILLSCVRGGGGGSSLTNNDNGSSNGGRGGIGFLAQRQRLNVALTRAKVCLVVVGNVSSLATKDSMWGALLEDARKRGCVVPVMGGQGGSEQYLKEAVVRL